MSDILVAYFSYSGTTERAAQKIADSVGAELFEIRTVRDYSSDYRTCVEEARAEKNSKARPALVQMPDSVDSYEKLVIAYPNWCSTCPMAVLTFLESYDLGGKEIFPLVTHGGGGISGEADISKSCPGAIVHKAKDGNRIRESEIAGWLDIE